MALQNATALHNYPEEAGEKLRGLQVLCFPEPRDPDVPLCSCFSKTLQSQVGRTPLVVVVEEVPEDRDRAVWSDESWPEEACRVFQCAEGLFRGLGFRVEGLGPW